ncbi:MAG: carbohydrate ABC transporter permease [Nitrososphaeria archaeon]
MSKRKIAYKKVIMYTFLLFYLIFTLFPIVWIIQASFKTMHQIFQIPPQLFFEPTIEAYQKLFRGEIFQCFLNSIIIATMNTLFVILLSIPAGYSLSRYRNRVSKNLSFWILSLRFAPAFAMILPFYLMMYHLRLIDTIFAVVLAHMIFNLPLAIWFLMGYFNELPIEIEEAAMIDGADRTQVMLKIVVPTSTPMIFAVAILVFLFSWNEFLFAFLLTSRDARTVPVLILSLTGTMKLDWPMMCAISTIAIIPAIIFVGYVQKYIVRGLTLGALK